MKVDLSLAMRDVSVEIEGAEYPVAKKTIRTDRQLTALLERFQANKDTIKPYEIWLEAISILLGEDVRATLFTAGENENLDRMEAIYWGVLRAYSRNRRDMEQERNSRQMEQLRETIGPLNKELSEMSDVIRMVTDSGE